LCAVDFAFEADVRDPEAALEVCQAVGTGAALLALAWAVIGLAIGVDLLGIVAFAVLATVAIAAIVMIFAIQRGWFAAYLAKTPDEDSASDDAKWSD
jgi:hypothetical protein